MDLINGNPFKAGLKPADKEDINKRILELSKGSKYYESQERKNQKTQERIASIQDKLHNQLTPADLKLTLACANDVICQLESTRNLTRYIAHVDMDAFYAACEILDNPRLANVPMAVGDTAMLCTSNYEARKYGVKSAMPGFIARDLCPDLVIVRPDFEKYKRKSAEVQQIFKLYDPQFDMMSLDEAYLDMTEYMISNSVTAAEAVETLREHIFCKTQLTASAGIAANRLLAKICSDINKPNNQFCLENDRDKILEFIKDLPTRKIPGIGKVTDQILSALGISTCYALFENRDKICALFSKTAYEFLLRVSIGIGSTTVGIEWNRKSISVERTFEPTGNAEYLRKKLLEIAQKLAQDMHKHNLSGKTLTLKYKTDEFEVKTRSKTIQRLINKDFDIYSLAREMLELELPLKLRLMGLRLSSFASDDEKSTREITHYFNVRKDKATLDVVVPDHIKSAFTCPICGKFIEDAADCESNLKLNQHIDLCLNRPAINELKPQPKCNQDLIVIDGEEENNEDSTSGNHQKANSTQTSSHLKKRKTEVEVSQKSVEFMKKFLEKSKS